MTTGPLRILIADDEAPARSRLRDVLDDLRPALPSTVVGEAASGAEVLARVQDTEVDVVLLDIRMPGMDGLECASHLRALPAPPAVIFTTAYQEHALAAFDLEAVDYLLKPVRAERLGAALARAHTLSRAALQRLRGGAPRTHFSVASRGRVRLVPVEEVVYLKAELKYLTLRTPEASHIVEDSLTQLEQEFGARFVRVHRNCLVARDRVTGFERDTEGGWNVVLRDIEERLPVSRRHQALVRGW
jgi:two-component system response regulator AlgR